MLVMFKEKYDMEIFIYYSKIDRYNIIISVLKGV